MKINDVILQSIAKIVVFIILTLALYLFFAGRHSPGGGFVAGLILAAAIVLLCLAFDIETVKEGLPIDFKLVAALGAFIVVACGIGATVLGADFLTQVFATILLPFFGDVDLTTVTLFESGVTLAVVGVVVTIILSISEDV